MPNQAYPDSPGWDDHILRAIHDLGGSASLKSIYAWLEDNAPLMVDQRGERYDTRPQFQHTVRACCSNLVKSGRLMRVQRATYQIRPQ